jgi:hypothetical protein
VTKAFVTHSSTTKKNPVSTSLDAVQQSGPPAIAIERFPVAPGSSIIAFHSSTITLQSYIQGWVQGQQQPFDLYNHFHFVEPANAAETTMPASVVAAVSPPTKQEVALLREAFSAFYGTNDRNPTKALDLLNQVVDAWQKQPADERAGLYRVRGDCYMALERPNDAITDYGIAIDLLQQPGVLEAADPIELPASL